MDLKNQLISVGTVNSCAFSGGLLINCQASPLPSLCCNGSTQ